MPILKLEQPETSFRADALFFDAARFHMKEARDHVQGFLETKAAVENQRRRIDLSSRSAVDDDDVHSRTMLWLSDILDGEPVADADEYDKRSFGDDVERLCIQMDSYCYDLSIAHCILIKEYSLVHVLCAATLEAHVNIIADEILGGKEKDEFFFLSLTAKWMFLPKLVGRTSFEVGSQPFQDFNAIVKYRNLLMHYKLQKEPWKTEQAPVFLDKIGLTDKAATKSMTATRRMITDIAEMLERPAPHWLDQESGDYLTMGY
jgi:hypothetical protein